MFLNNETDYAIRIVACLADSVVRLDGGTIAERTGVTPRFTLKILHRLTHSGIIKSFKGSKGGYTLAVPADEITLLRVVEIMCGPFTLSRCQSGEAECTHPMGICYFRGAFDDVSNYMRDKFSKVTFAKGE